jgi:bifunctional DNA-binding transcriptional regulator/antitoxin component of YhaV-PrlF toxin-antitoxin module|tara:strand:+ start:315 stop:458 length:144 start_codon:yes stop_codon:yes gene_type:complete
MPKLQEVDGKFTITIPKEYVEQAKLKKGDTLVLNFNERGNLELVRIK